MVEVVFSRWNEIRNESNGNSNCTETSNSSRFISWRKKSENEGSINDEKQFLKISNDNLTPLSLPYLRGIHHPYTISLLSSPYIPILQQTNIMVMILIAALFTLSLAYLSHGRTWEDILHADITCCNTVTDQEECEATYGGSSCVWLEWGISDDTDDIITQSGSQCVGTEYYSCRIETDECCAPGCPGLSTGSTTTSPAYSATPAPTRVCTAN